MYPNKSCPQLHVMMVYLFYHMGTQQYLKQTGPGDLLMQQL